MERTNGVALWRQIELRLTDEIRAGTWTEGKQLPTEAVLATRFNVNRHTLRRAMGALEAAGVVRIEQGRGTFCKKTWLIIPLASARVTQKTWLLTTVKRVASCCEASKYRLIERWPVLWESGLMTRF